MWHTLTDCEQPESDKITANVDVSEDSLWFSGHFPEEPILPGIAQIKIIFDLLNQFNGGNLKIEGVSRVRFKKIIRPNDKLKLVATKHKDKPKLYIFKILAEDELACSGNITVQAK